MINNEKSKSVINCFDNIATEYVEYFGDDWEFIEQIKEFAKKFNENSTIIDLGSGSGYITKYLTDFKLNCIGIDFSEEMIKISKSKYPKLKFIKDDFINIENYFKEDSIDFFALSYPPLLIHTLVVINKSSLGTDDLAIASPTASSFP